MKTMRQKLITALTAAVACFLLIPTAAADQVVNDDCIIIGSQCIGQDCVNGESFGFDTLRLKENNLRMHFQDTSSTSSFPSADWRIQANDSSNGGANYLGIQDSDNGTLPFRVEKGAGANALVVEDGGQIGFGTLNPVVDLHVVSGNTPTLRLEQDGSSGFTPQTWDLAGNETNFFLRDVTHGSKLPFRIRPDAPGNSIFVDADGDIGLGTASPSDKLDVQVDADNDITMNVDGIKVTSVNNDFTKLTLARGGSATWEFAVVAGANFVFNRSDDGSPVQATFGSNGDLSLTGDVITNNCPTGCGPADFVFAPDYELESIEDHASFMWENSHLPAIGKGKMENIPLLKMSNAIVEELEKAHIYIERLNEQLKNKEAEVDNMSNRLARLEALVSSK